MDQYYIVWWLIVSTIKLLEMAGGKAGKTKRGAENQKKRLPPILLRQPLCLYTCALSKSSEE